MKPERNLNIIWELRVYSDTYYSVDNYTRKIVTGCVILLNIFVII